MQRHQAGTALAVVVVLGVSLETPGTAAAVVAVPLMSLETPGKASTVQMVSPGVTRDSTSGVGGVP